jgi:hypothetical protein
MKDQVDSFKRNNNNFKVVAISGYLTPLERKNDLVEVENGVADFKVIPNSFLKFLLISSTTSGLAVAVKQDTGIVS